MYNPTLSTKPFDLPMLFQAGQVLIRRRYRHVDRNMLGFVKGSLNSDSMWNRLCTGYKFLLTRRTPLLTNVHPTRHPRPEPPVRAVTSGVRFSAMNPRSRQEISACGRSIQTMQDLLPNIENSRLARFLFLLQGSLFFLRRTIGLLPIGAPVSCSTLLTSFVARLEKELPANLTMILFHNNAFTAASLRVRNRA